MNADLRHLLALTKGHVSQTQLLNDLLGRMPCSLHLKESLRGLAQSTILSIQMARLKGERPPDDHFKQAIVGGAKSGAANAPTEQKSV